MKPHANIPIHITPHHLTLSPALVRKVFGKIGPLARIAADAIRADVLLRLHHGSAHGKLFSASARLVLPGGDLHASATHADLYAAITELESRLARRLRKRKTRIENRIESGRPRGGVTSAARLEESLLTA